MVKNGKNILICFVLEVKKCYRHNIRISSNKSLELKNGNCNI